MFNTSLSAAQAWQECEARYDYAYVKRLRPRTKAAAPELGTLLHDYLEHYYRSLMAGLSATEGHTAGLGRILLHQPRMTAAANLAWKHGDEELAKEIIEVVPRAGRIASDYFDTRGRWDAEQYDVLLVEERVQLLLAPGVVSRSTIDLVLHDRMRDLTFLVEHKSTGTVPDSGVRLRDLQTLLYAETMRSLGLPAVDGILWNYLRTKEPTEPRLLKQKHPALSRAADLDTTWTVYARAIKEHGLDPEAYADMRARLDGRERTVFFPRHEHVIVADASFLIADYAEVSRRMRTATARWAAGNGRPVRHLSRNCNWCPYRPLCMAAITGGDEEDVIRLRYTTEREERV